MSHHHATLLIDGDHLRVEITCTAGPDDECRQSAIGDCECEEYSLERNPAGEWGHLVYADVHEFRPMDSGQDQCKQCDELPEHEVHTGEEEIWHPMRSVPGFCNYRTWLTEAGNPEESYDGPADVPLNNTPITFTWEGDHYLWKPTEGSGVTP